MFISSYLTQLRSLRRAKHLVIPCMHSVYESTYMYSITTPPRHKAPFRYDYYPACRIAVVEGCPARS